MKKTVYVGATVIDGTGAPAAARDVFIAGERIEETPCVIQKAWRG